MMMMMRVDLDMATMEALPAMEVLRFSSFTKQLLFLKLSSDLFFNSVFLLIDNNDDDDDEDYSGDSDDSYTDSEDDSDESDDDDEDEEEDKSKKTTEKWTGSKHVGV